MKSEKQLDKIVPDVNKDYFPDIDSRYTEGPKFIQMSNFKGNHAELVDNPSAEGPRQIPNKHLEDLRSDAQKKVYDANVLSKAIKPPVDKKEQQESLHNLRYQARIDNETKIDEANENTETFKGLLTAARNARIAELEARNAHHKLAIHEAYEKELKLRQAEKEQRAKKIDDMHKKVVAKKSTPVTSQPSSKITLSKANNVADGATGPSTGAAAEPSVEQIFIDSNITVTPAYRRAVDRFQEFDEDTQRLILHGKKFPKTPTTLQKWIDQHLKTIGEQT